MQKLMILLVMGLSVCMTTHAVTPQQTSPPSQDTTTNTDHNAQQPLATDPTSMDNDTDKMGPGSGDEVNVDESDSSNDPDPEADDLSTTAGS